MKLLSISLARHDGNVSYFDGEKVRYIKLERLKQIKRFSAMDRYSWKYEIKNMLGIDVENMDEIVFDFHIENFYKVGEEPQEILEVKKGIKPACKIPLDNNPFQNYLGNQKLYYIGHHFAHSLSSWMLCQNPDVSINIDGEGDKRTWSVYRGETLVDYGKMEDGTIGGCMGETAARLGIQGPFNDLAGKLMSFVSYGQIDKNFLLFLKQFNYRQIEDIFNIEHWYNYVGDRLVADHILINWASTVHYYMGDVLIDMFSKYARPEEKIVYAGGVAQNIVWNTRLREHFPNLVIPPHSSDEGLSLGGLEWLRRKNNLPEFNLDLFPYVQDDQAPLEKPNIKTIRKVASILAQGYVVAWYQGNGEAGPRALGNRSILMDSRLKGGKDKINFIKRRENFRPFGATVLEEYLTSISDAKWNDPFMLYTCKLTDQSLESIRHIDGTCRLQTIDKSSPSSFRVLLEEFYQQTGCPCLLNTSLNLSGKPIAGYTEIALTVLQETAVDCAVIGNTIYAKKHIGNVA